VQQKLELKCWVFFNTNENPLQRDTLPHYKTSKPNAGQREKRKTNKTKEKEKKKKKEKRKSAGSEPTSTA